jgi:hypothetical protein
MARVIVEISDDDAGPSTRTEIDDPAIEVALAGAASRAARNHGMNFDQRRAVAQWLAVLLRAEAIATGPRSHAPVGGYGSRSDASRDQCGRSGFGSDLARAEAGRQSSAGAGHAVASEPRTESRGGWEPPWRRGVPVWLDDASRMHSVDDVELPDEV